MISDWTSHFYKAHRKRIYTALGLGVVGALSSVASIYATPVMEAPVLSCGLEALSCSEALTSDYSKVGGVPLGIFGLAYFTFWTLNLRAFQLTSNHGYLVFLSWITLLGAVGSCVLGFIMFFVLKAPCLYCLLTHLSNLGSFVLLWPVRRWRMETEFSWEQLRHFLALSAIALLAATALHFANQTRLLEAKIESLEEK